MNDAATSTEDDAPIDDAPPELNPNLDRAQFAQAFARTGRVHIPNIFTDASARRLHYALEKETPWGLTFNEGKETRELAAVSAEDRDEMAMAAWARAHSGFQYFYHYYGLLRDREIHPEPDHYLGKLVGLLTSPHLLAFAREISGIEAIAWVSSTATLYKPLDFLKIHDDDARGSGKRLVAYVLNMTPTWAPDWGGALQFYDRRDHIEEGFLPTFNSLNMFRVPQLHSVAQVAIFGGFRYSVSGWFESA